MDNKDGGQAFPCGLSADQHAYQSGMSLREYYAGQALTALIPMFVNGKLESKNGEKIDEKIICEQSFHFANAMIEARNIRYRLAPRDLGRGKQ